VNLVEPMAVPDYTVADFSQETWWLTLIKAVFIVVYLILSVLMALWVERRGLGRMQTRPGPNVAGPLGLFQAVADAVKLLFKEDIRSTERADKFLYWLGPTLAAFCAFSTMAVIPMGPNVSMFGHSTPLQLADMPVATLYILAITSLGLYGIVLGGWSAHSTLPLYGAVRSSAQVISYELSMGLALVSVFLMTGSMSTSEIVADQGRLWWFIPLIPAFVIYCISAVGEINRLPFDLPEAEGELVAGHMTEYTGMKFGWYYLSEYINMLNVSAVATTMFFGGWHAPWPFSHIAPINDGWWGMLWFILKVWFFMFLIIWTRGTLVRIRYDQFMAFGWKRLIPVSLAWVVAVALLRGVTSWVSMTLPQLLGVIVALFIVVMLVMWLWDRGEAKKEEAEEAAEQDQAEAPFDPFAGGFPVPPLPGQVLPASPRAGRAPVAAVATETTGAGNTTGTATEEDSDE
jgi:NADH-quinone oxidoreductase subunit H